MKKQIWPVMTAIVVLSLSPGRAEEPRDTTQLLFNRQHQAGIRLGVWSNQGESPPETDSARTFETSISDENFHLEGFYAHRLWSFLMLEGSLGLVNRGSVTFREEGADNVGNMLVYSILVHLKFYPLSGLETKLQPYITTGGGIFYGRRSVQFTTNVFYTGFGEQSETDLNYALGGGVDYPIGTTIGLEAGVRYMSISFSEPLLTVRDYDALAFFVGVKYLYEQ